MGPWLDLGVLRGEIRLDVVLEVSCAIGAELGCEWMSIE
jgi:hypothetical protein